MNDPEVKKAYLGEDEDEPEDEPGTGEKVA
jgi:hypothetical protein